MSETKKKNLLLVPDFPDIVYGVLKFSGCGFDSQQGCVELFTSPHGGQLWKQRGLDIVCFLHLLHFYL
jgi:hypothetical protein